MLFCQLFGENTFSKNASKQSKTVQDQGSVDHLNGREVTGPFPLCSCRNSVHKSGVDVQIAWMRHNFMDETPLFPYWGGQGLRPDFMISQFATLSGGSLDFVAARNLAGGGGIGRLGHR